MMQLITKISHAIKNAKRKQLKEKAGFSFQIHIIQPTITDEQQKRRKE